MIINDKTRDKEKKGGKKKTTTTLTTTTVQTQELMKINKSLR